MSVRCPRCGRLGRPGEKCGGLLGDCFEILPADPAAAVQSVNATLHQGFAQSAASGAALQRSVAGGFADMSRGFAQVDARLGHIALTQEQLVAYSAQQLAQLEAMRRQQAQQYLVEQQRREQEAYLHALYARAATAIHEGLLALRSLGRQLEAPEVDLPSLWLRLFEVERSTRGLDPTRVDPAQRRDLLELRDALAASREALVRRAGDAGHRVDSWLSLEQEARQIGRSNDELLRHVAQMMHSQDPSWVPPSNATEAGRWVEEAQREVAELQAEYPEPLPNVCEALVRSVLNQNRPTPGGDADALRAEGLAAREHLLRYESLKARLPVQLRWGALGLGGAFGLFFGLSFLFVGIAIGLGLGERATGPALLLALGLGSALPTYGSVLANRVERAGRQYYQWLWAEWSRGQAATQKLADARALHHALQHAEQFWGDPQKGQALEELNAWRSDLRPKVTEVALLN
jgi:hypothetical protein